MGQERIIHAALLGAGTAGDGTDEWTDASFVPTLYGLDPAGKYSEAFC